MLRLRLLRLSIYTFASDFTNFCYHFDRARFSDLCRVRHSGDRIDLGGFEIREHLDGRIGASRRNWWPTSRSVYIGDVRPGREFKGTVQ